MVLFTSPPATPLTSRTDLFEANLNDDSTKKIAEGISAYDISSNSLYFLQNNNILYKCDLDGNNVFQLSSNSFTDEALAENARLIVYDDDRQALITDNDDLFVRNNATEDTIRNIESNVSDIQFSDDGKKLLYWNNNEINVLFLRPWDVQPYRDENEIQSIIRLSTPLKNVFWYKDYEHILYSTGKEIRMIELDTRDHRVSNKIFENDIDDFPAAYDSGKGIYYFLQDENGLRSIYYFDFPKKTGFFG